MSDEIVEGSEFHEPIFFQTPEVNKAVFRVAQLFAAEADDPMASTEKSQVVDFISHTLNFMAENGAALDSFCAFNIKHIGSKFKSELQSFFKFEPPVVSVLLASCYRFVVEFELKSTSGLPPLLNEAWHSVVEVPLSVYSAAKNQLRYANFHMATHVLREYLTHPGVERLRKLPETIALSDIAMEKAKIALDSREQRLEVISEKLKNYQVQFNFLGLVKGFSELRSTKQRERESNLRALWALGFVLVLIPVLKMFDMVPAGNNIAAQVGAGLAALALELMVIYFFRITLQNFRSIKSQILQFDLRLTLCQFIESYVDFAKEARKDDKELLVRFEQIIFSSITADESVIPSTFDGVEQITALIQKMKA